MYDVCIIGAGASGMTAAIVAASQKANVLIIEKMDKMGKKILATGNGKCNLTNTDIDKNALPVSNYRSSNPVFSEKVLQSFDYKDTLLFFERMSLYVKNKNGYIYPASEQASSVSDVLKWQMAQMGVDVVTETMVTEVKSIHGRQPFFKIRTHQKQYEAKKVIIANGGKSGVASLGSDGSGYDICRKMGHHLIPIVPALCALHCEERFFKELAGIRLQGRVQIISNGKELIRDEGELQLTAYGISGIPVFQVSRYAAYALMNHQTVDAVLDLLPELDAEELVKRLMMQVNAHPDWTVKMILSGMINKKLAGCLLKSCKLNEQTTGRKLRQSDAHNLADRLKAFKVHITATNTFEQSQVTAGGIDTKEINPQTMESLLVPGVYIVGELLDVDGICGGYNLQWAWATGYLAGMHAGRSSC